MTQLDIEAPPATVPAATLPLKPCVECRQSRGHKATCPAVEPPCGCGLADCRDCMRRPGARAPYTERASSILPRNQRARYRV